jgi:hypothetical protein
MNNEEISQLQRTLLFRNLQDVLFCRWSRSTAGPFVGPGSGSNEEASELVSLIAQEVFEVFPEHFGSRHDENHSQCGKGKEDSKYPR